MTLPQEIYVQYLEIFEELWGIAPERSVIVGEHGNGLFEAEFQEHGSEAYLYSVVQPIRNAWYSAFCMQDRWDRWLSKLEIAPPVLDFGCGVGFQLRWLEEFGHEDLWGLDLGVTQKVLQKMGERSEIQSVDIAHQTGAPKFNTIFCIHVLEHTADPMGLLRYLRSFGAKLYAGCVLTEGHGHIAPMAEREKVLESLREQGELIEWEPPSSK